MKKILITGANSFIGTSFESYLKKWEGKYCVEALDMHGDKWRDKDFSAYDVIFHVAGIAHSDTADVSEERRNFYYKINTDLAVETANKAKDSGVRQFIFMSSSIIYGKSSPIGESKLISRDTVPSPGNFYGNSKLQAENRILPLQDEGFNVVVLRLPMVYGKGCRGNYNYLSKLAGILPIFPYVKNERSMIYIGNLCEFCRLMIENEEQGIFHPQNAEYSNTSELVALIAKAHGKRILLLRGFGWVLKLLGHLSEKVSKAFGNLTYDMAISEYKENYRVYGLAESIVKTEE